MKSTLMQYQIEAIGYIGSIYLIIYKTQTPNMESIYSIITILAPLSIIIYHASKLRKDIVNSDHNGSWWSFLKSWFKSKTKRKKK